jgi:preprotein translocase subunit SecG
MLVLLTVIHVLVCLFLIIVVLLQSGKAADLAGAFGGMGSQTAFGPRGSATLLSKATTISAVVFMITSLSLSIMATRGSRTGSTALERQKTAPAAPAGTTPSTGQPSVTVFPEGGGPSQTIPLDIPPRPGTPAQPGTATQPGQAAPTQPQGQQQPARPEPQQKK